jgi:hypothetical protein
MSVINNIKCLIFIVINEQWQTQYRHNPNITAEHIFISFLKALFCYNIKTDKLLYLIT